MPSRRLQTFCVLIFLLCLWLTDKNEITSLWILLPAGLLVVASFIFSDLINEWWFHRIPPDISSYERNWLANFVPYYAKLREDARKRFDSKLAKQLFRKEFIHMAEKDIPEEWKIMALAPAVYLGLDHTSKDADHYNRIVFYMHQFPSPKQDYLHVSEVEHEDGVLIFSVPHLESSYIKPESYFNTANYEWGEVFFKIHGLPQSWSENKVALINDCCQSIQITESDLLKYLCQDELSYGGMIMYYFLSFPAIMQIKWKEQYDYIEQFVLN